jgi:hypothetical protein
LGGAATLERSGALWKTILKSGPLGVLKFSSSSKIFLSPSVESVACPLTGKATDTNLPEGESLLVFLSTVAAGVTVAVGATLFRFATDEQSRD